MEYGLAIFLLAVGTIIFTMFYNISGWFHVTVRGIFGAKKIRIVGVSSAIRGDEWIAIPRTLPDGSFTAWRYPSSKLGLVSLNADGTGEYCGKIMWEYI